jgi:hypothetical protein
MSPALPINSPACRKFPNAADFLDAGLKPVGRAGDIAVKQP